MDKNLTSKIKMGESKIRVCSNNFGAMEFSPETLKKIYNFFDPLWPLPAGDPAYVDCTEVRGDGDVITELGNPIVFSARQTCQLYAGHRGAGKSTELRRLEEYLKKKEFTVVYFAADEEDIDPEDTQYTDVLLSCARHVLKQLQGSGDNPVWRWIKSRSQELKTLLDSEIQIENVSVEAQIKEFAKITATLKASPATRDKIRQLVEPHTPSLVIALNEFIKEAMQNKPPNRLVIIADNLDRIVPVSYGDHRRSNHDQIFVDRNEQLKKLDCHVIYTIPISLVYSDRGTTLEDYYGPTQVLPMIMVRTLDGTPHEPGISKVSDLIQKRVQQIDPKLTGSNIFETPDALNHACLMSGGHLRTLVQLIRTAIEGANALPIPDKALLRAISILRSTYQNTILEDEWATLAQVHKSKQVENNEQYRKLLFSRCILEYRYLDEGQEGGTFNENETNDQNKKWYDIHPLIRGIDRFKRALERLPKGDNP